jgi:hypothetical protein
LGHTEFVPGKNPHSGIQSPVSDVAKTIAIKCTKNNSLRITRHENWDQWMIKMLLVFSILTMEKA